jgi:hypothetical protein
MKNATAKSSPAGGYSVEASATVAKEDGEESLTGTVAAPDRKSTTNRKGMHEKQIR